MEKLDLSKPFFFTERNEQGNLVVHSNQPNNTVGDFQFEWDLDGSVRRKSEELAKEQIANGTYGDLVYFACEFLNNPELDSPIPLSEPLSSHFLMFDITDEKK